MVKMFLLGFSLLLVAVFLMGIRVFFTRHGSFPNIHIGNSRAMRERGIHCATSQDAQQNRKESPVEKIVQSKKNKSY